MSLSFELQGTLHKIEPIQQISDTFKKRNIIIVSSDNPMYKEYITFELLQDDCSLVDSLQEGDCVVVYFNIRGRVYQDKNTGEPRYFTFLRAWKINKIDQPKEDNIDDKLPF
ncbi:MAG: DUF3127 domain-containing protein [Cytophagales bacterium]|nr:DUF3127 domain-containing protein [Cytophagales bacterium]